MKRIVALLSTFLAILTATQAQRVVYSEPDKDDIRSVNFEIIGKLNGNFVIYKNTRDDHYISLYDNDMKMTEKVELTFLPERITNAEFITYNDHFFMIYQYQRRSVMYLAAVKLDGKGTKLSEPVVIDTTDVNFFANGNTRLYSVINSENKEHIAAIKINSKDDKQYSVVAVTMDKDMKVQRKTRVYVPMPERNDFLSEFNIDNNGDIVFLREFGTSSNDNVNQLSLLTLKNGAPTVDLYDLGLKDLYLDDVKLKVNNANGQYLVTSFFSRTKRGAIEGLFNHLWDKNTLRSVVVTTSAFENDFRNNVRGQNNMKNAFDDLFLQHIIMRKDGGFIVTAEANYATTRGNSYNRWDYLNSSPFWSPSDYYLWRNYAYTAPWWRYYNNFNSVTRYFADNIAIMSFDNTGRMEWNNVINKSQFDDNNDNALSYSTMITGGEIHFFFNNVERRTMLLSDQSITAEGQLKRNPTLKNLDRGYDLMPRYGKQVSARQMIIPCQYRNYICFAKVEF